MNIAKPFNMCCIGSPRSGSQYITNLISNNFENSLNLQEPFTINHLSGNIVLTNNFEINYDNTIVFQTKNEQIEHVLNVLKYQKTNNNIILKLFLTEEYEVIDFKNIIDTLTFLNFKFLVIKRHNILEQILSFLIACQTNIWYWHDGEKLTSVTIEDVGPAFWLINQISNFENIISELNINNLQHVRYENAIEDLSAYFNKEIIDNNNFKKISELPKTKLINNYNEIINIIQDELINRNLI